MEIRIADMLSAGNLSAFYEEYMAIRGGDQNFGRVLRFLSSKPREIQTEALRAVVNPGEYAWPDGTGEGIYGAAEFFERAGRPPLRRDYLNSLLAEYLLPSSILDRLKSPAAYQPAADRLEAWSAKGLLLPTSADWKYKNADADSYERAARSICLGHTAHSSADLEDAIRELAEFQNERPGLSIPRITDRLINLRNGKLSPRDRNFIGELTKTIREARAASHKLKKNLPARVAASGAAGAVIYASWLAAGLPGGAAMFSAGLALMWAEFASVALARLNNPFAGSSGEWSGEGHGAMNRPKKFSAAAERLWDGTGRGEFRLAAMTGLCAAAGSALLIFLPLAGGALNLDGLASPAAGLIFPAAMAALPFAASFVIRAYKTSMLKFDVAKLCREYSGGMGDGD
jgi:hypothetical protein